MSFEKEGYVILKDAVKVNKQFLNFAHRVGSKAGAIFNHNLLKRNDNLRKQTRIKVKETDLPGISQLFKDHQDKNPSPWVIVYSSPGCQEQAAHTDWIPCEDISKGADALSCIVALENNTTLTVWPGSHKWVRQPSQCLHNSELIYLEAGDVIFFRSDLIHAGSAYIKANVRLHCYLDAPHIPRLKNRTWFINNCSK